MIAGRRGKQWEFFPQELALLPLLRARKSGIDLTSTRTACSIKAVTPHLSVVVPVSRLETEGEDLFADLRAAGVRPDACAGGDVLELILAAPEPPEDLPQGVRHVRTRPGRAAQMNDAAHAAQGRFLWFLHADSRLPVGAFEALQRSLASDADALHFFRLRFHDGPFLLRLNEIGVRFRANLLKLPFGDQGFCLHRSVFFELGGFDETAPYGEDHLLAWAAHRNGIKLRAVAAVLSTSGRKYAEQGWALTTARHVWRTIAHAYPQWRGIRGHRSRSPRCS